MWRLISANLKYQAKSFLNGVLVVLLLATIINVGLPILNWAPSPEDDFKLFYFYSILLVFLGLILSFRELGTQRREFRLHLTAQIPCTKTNVALARVLSPVFILLGCMTLSVLVMIGLQLVMHTGIYAWRSFMLTFFGGLFLVVSQLPVLIEELRPALQRSRLAQTAFLVIVLSLVSVMLLRALSEYINFLPQITSLLRTDISMNPENVAYSLFLHGVGWFIVAVNVLLFRQRESI